MLCSVYEGVGCGEETRFWTGEGKGWRACVWGGAEGMCGGAEGVRIKGMRRGQGERSQGMMPLRDWLRTERHGGAGVGCCFWVGSVGGCGGGGVGGAAQSPRQRCQRHRSGGEGVWLVGSAEEGRATRLFGRWERAAFGR